MLKAARRRIDVLRLLGQISVQWNEHPDINAIAEGIFSMHCHYRTPYKASLSILTAIRDMDEKELYRLSLEKKPIWEQFCLLLPERQRVIALGWFVRNPHTAKAAWDGIEKRIRNWAISYEAKKQ